MRQKRHPAQLRNAVESPGGTTIAGNSPKAGYLPTKAAFTLGGCPHVRKAEPLCDKLWGEGWSGMGASNNADILVSIWKQNCNQLALDYLSFLVVWDCLGFFVKV